MIQNTQLTRGPESVEDLSQEDIDMIYEQEHLQFLMDHHLFYWKMDRYMLTVDQRPLPAQIAQDRYLAHGARQNLLELWKKKDLMEKRNLIEKDA